MIAIGAGALAAAGAFAMPATGPLAPGKAIRHAPAVAPALAFTPAAADPRLAAVFARGGLDTVGFRFTPAEARRDNRAVTVVARARTGKADTRLIAAEPLVGIAPIAYNLGVGVGWRRFGITGDVGKVDLAGQPGGREAADVTVSYSGSRVTGRVKGVVDRALADVPAALTTADHSYALDVGGSYRLTRNMDLTAGVRYRTDRDRLVRLDDDRRDSQAVYVGTAFRF